MTSPQWLQKRVIQGLWSGAQQLSPDRHIHIQREAHGRIALVEDVDMWVTRVLMAFLRS